MYRHEITEMQRMLNPQHVLGSGMTPAQLWKWYRNTVANQQVMHYGTTEHKQVFSMMHNVTRRQFIARAGSDCCHVGGRAEKFAHLSGRGPRKSLSCRVEGREVRTQLVWYYYYIQSCNLELALDTHLRFRWVGGRCVCGVYTILQVSPLTLGMYTTSVSIGRFNYF
eukprot:SAG22_NODE_1023_length_5990_cov_16.923782_5_plen_167_part_00